MIPEDFMSSGAPTIEQALECFLTGVSRITETEQVPLLRSSGRVLAEEIRAPFSVPSFPKSAMDGYAVRSDEVKQATKEHPVSLRVLGEILAGDRVDGSRTKSERGSGSASSDGTSLTAYRIMTGAQVPDGYDAVVREEDTDYGESEVRIFKGVSQYQNYCRVGEDIREGEVILPEGTLLGRTEIGTLASMGISRVSVRRKLRVRIICTGSELLEVGAFSPNENITEEDGSGSVAALTGTVPPEGKIYNSIAYMLEASILDAGFEASHVICRDETEEIRDAILEASEEADVILTTGGVSVGKKDLLPEILEMIGAETRFRRARIQPGTPTIGASFHEKSVLCLSGNPYAAIANFDLYFWPLAAGLTGCDAFLPTVEEAILVTPYEKVNVMRRLIRARVENGHVSLPAKSHASSVLSNLMTCNCYLDLPEGQKISVGDRVTIRRFMFN